MKPELPENFIKANGSCIVCDGDLFRHPMSDHLTCKNWHVTWRGVQAKPDRYILREHREDEIDPWTENSPAWLIWDVLTDEPVYDPGVSEEYAWDLTESRARSWYARLVS